MLRPRRRPGVAATRTDCEDTDFELEKIIDERLEDGEVQYLGKWYATIMSGPEERAYTRAGYVPSLERYPDADFEAGGQKWRIVFWAPTWMPAASAPTELVRDWRTERSAPVPKRQCRLGDVSDTTMVQAVCSAFAQI